MLVESSVSRVVLRYDTREYGQLDYPRLTYSLTIRRHVARPRLMVDDGGEFSVEEHHHCLLYTSPSPRDGLLSRMPSSA